MKDLIQEYFERDLSPSEERRLRRQLLQSEADALRFSKEAERFHLGLGFLATLMTVRAVFGRVSAKSGASAVVHAFAAKTVLAVAVTVASGTAIWYGVEKMAESVKQAQASLLNPALPKAAPAPQRPLPRRDQVGDFFSIRLELPTSRALSVRIVDSQGQVIRDFHSSFYKAGTQWLHWDGQKDDGTPAQPGTYTVEVNFGTGVLKRKLRLEES